MTDATILATKNQALYNTNQKQKRKRASERIYISKGGIVFGREGQNCAKRTRINETTTELEVGKRGEASFTRTLLKCSICGSLEHNARICPDRCR